MPSTVLDAPRVAVPRPVRPAAPARPRTTPLPVVALAGIAVVESLGLLALGLTSLDGVLGTVVRPSGGLVATTLVLLAGWVVLCAGGGASLLDGAGRTLVVSVACGEISLLVVLGLAAALGADGMWLVAVGPLGALPVPALALLALAVPFSKLLLSGTPSALAWVAAGPRPRTRRPAVAPGRPVLRGATLAVIGLALTSVTLLGSPADAATVPTTAAVDSAP
ncbi:hypothetical protein SAMN05661080_04330 [Modestobacter sp. DSM 44400]|uniref:hypothetical protein n=1 Tax=Modestobacter sp. DSM 44400 TaxID=1550230 RepID=UPI00089921C9|nr:hypothetical protein [Modestobacter sp. DSM 44400]SDY69994.1 hypothetical protein SAMN05661080_04330 [Modestobacter sp. DSM 44400]